MRAQRELRQAVAAVALAAVGLAATGCPPKPGPPPVAPRRPAAPPTSAQTVSAALQRMDGAIEAGRFSAVARTIRDILAVEPDHLEAWVVRALAAEAAGDAGARAEAWARVEQILVFHGQMEPFVLRATLLGAARHYLEVQNDQRADLFAEDLLRRYPTSEHAARLLSLRAELGFQRRRWDAVVEACAQLAQSFAGHRSAPRCAALSRRAARLRDVGPEADPGAGVWTWDWPQPQGNELHGVWVGPRGEVVAVGDAGTIVTRRGERFERVPSGTRWDLHAVVGAAPDALFAVGAGGIVLGFDGKSWRTLRAPEPESEDLFAAYSAGPAHLVAVGAAGAVVQRAADGRFSASSVADADLRGVWGRGEEPLYAVGQGGALLELRGGRWQKLTSDSYEDLWALHGLSPTEIVAVGSKRTLVRFDGAKGKEEIVGLADLRAVWLGKGGRGWAVGRGGATLRLEAGRWRTVPAGTLLDLRAVAGSEDGREVWAVGDGGTILRERSGRWSIAAGGMRQRLVAVSAAARPALALGENGALLLRERRGRWTMQTLPVLGRYHDLWSDGRGLAAVGRGGLLVVRDGGGYRQIPTGTSEDLLAVWGAADALFAVGTRGTAIRVGGSTVQRDLLPTGLDLHDVWGRVVNAGREVFAVGARGAILRFDGQRWLEEPSGTLADLRAVWGTSDLVVAVGDGGVVLRRNAHGRWSLERGPAGQDLVDVWGVYASSIYAVARGGTVIHFDGQRWSVQESPAACLTAVDGTAEVGALAVGCHGSILSATPPR